MLAGYPPFYDDNPFGIYEKILSGKIEWPKHLDPVAKDLIKKLLVQDRTKRLGNMKVKIGFLAQIYTKTNLLYVCTEWRRRCKTTQVVQRCRLARCPNEEASGTVYANFLMNLFLCLRF